MLLSVAGWASQGGAQVQPQNPPAAPPAPAPLSATSFTPAPVPSRPPSSDGFATANKPAPADAPLAPGSVRVRINGSMTGYAGVGSDSGRTGR